MKWIKKQAKKQLTLLRRHLSAFEQEVDFNLLHDMRVAIKKLKSILRLLQADDKKFNYHKAYISLRNLFRACGTIREVHVAQNLMIQYAIPNELNPDIENEMIDPFLDEIPAYKKMVKRQSKDILNRADNVRKKSYKNYVRKLQKKVMRQLSNKIRTEDLHYLRKSVKELTYLMKKNENTAWVELLQQSADLIGEWNDKHNLVAMLVKAAPENKDRIARLQAETNKDRRAIYKLNSKLLQALSNGSLNQPLHRAV